MPRITKSSATDGKRAHVTLLFIDLCDWTAISELIDPEVADAFRWKVERLVARIVKKHDGAVVQFMGDGSLAVFGLPLPQEHDSRRAVDAALEAHEAARKLTWKGAAPPGFQVRLHSGLHSGLVFVRAGDTLHGKYEITGDAVNLAARLSDAAEHDQILVSGATLRGVRAFFSTEPARELRLKGKRELVRVSRVTGRTDIHDRYEERRRSGLTPFVGREEQLINLEAVLEDACNARGKLIVVKGVAGIGKTRLLDELRIRASRLGMRVLGSVCDGYGEVGALDPFLQILRQLFGFTPGLAPITAANEVMEKLRELGIEEHSATFLRLLSLPRAGSEEHPRTVTALTSLRALGALVARLTAQQPLAVLLDDWQWADETSRSVLRVLCRHSSRQQLCVVLSMRADRRLEIGVSPHLVLELSPLSGHECIQALMALRSRDLDSRLTSALIERSGGNPLFLEELCYSLPADVLAGETALEHSGIPNTLRGLIQARVARLSAGENETLRLAAVIGLEFSAATLARIHGECVDDTLTSLSAHGLIYTVGDGRTYHFKHGITRDVVYETVRIAQRRELHAAIASAFEAAAGADLRDHLETLAFHYRGSEQHERAATFAELAGDKAASSSFLSPARIHYAAALASLDRLTSSRELTLRWLAINAKWSAHAAFAPARSDLVLLERAVSYAAIDRRSECPGPQQPHAGLVSLRVRRRIRGDRSLPARPGSRGADRRSQVVHASSQDTRTGLRCARRKRVGTATPQRIHRAHARAATKRCECSLTRTVCARLGRACDCLG